MKLANEEDYKYIIFSAQESDMKHIYVDTNICTYRY